MQRINSLSELKACIVATSIQISNSLHVLILLQSLPDYYEVVQQMLLTTLDFTKITATKINDVCAHILSEELHQGSLPSVSAIRKVSSPSTSIDKCNICSGTGDWEKDCQCKQ